MFLKHLKTSILLIGILLPVLAIPISFAGNYEHTYTFNVQFGLVNHDLFVSVPSSLYEYYNGKIIKLTNDNQYSTLVTPDAVKPIADNIRNLTLDSARSDQEFANTVLALVHQIPYANCEVMYPIETLVENLGKCDTLSLLAASIMKAGGLDVVLLYYKEAHHINVGVHLPYEPHTTWWWLPPTGYEHNGKKYWIAECTPAMDWKVGDIPPLLEDEQPTIITLENSEKTSPAQVSSKCCTSFQSSSITINLSTEHSGITDQALTLSIFGSLSPAYPNETIAVYFSQDGIFYNAGKTSTDHFGNYSFSWTLNSTGTHYVRTSWSGNANHTGADSEILTVFIGFPQSLFEFTAPGYFFTNIPKRLASNEIRDRQGIRDFLDVQLSGTGVLLTGEFIILRDKQNVSKIQMQEITIPARETMLRRGRRWLLVQIPERTILKLVNMPKDMHQIRLPDNFDQTMNNKFGFIMRNTLGDNYSVSVKGMNAYDLVHANQPNGTGTIFMNVSESIRENTWYEVKAIMTETEITATLYDVKGALVESIQIPYNNENISDLVVLIADNTEKSVAFKNLRVSTLANPAQQMLWEIEKEENGKELLALNLAAILLITAFATVVLKKR